MNVEMWTLDRLKPYKHNPRRNAKAVASVALSIQEYGFRVPLVVTPEGLIIAGHTRLEAAKRLGLTEVPVHVADLDDAQSRAFRIADNLTGDIADWDLGLLDAEIDRLTTELDGFDLAALGLPAEEAEASQKALDQLKPEDVSEDQPKLERFQARRREAMARGKDAEDHWHYVVAVFANTQQRDEFVTRSGLEAVHHMYVKGQDLADKMGVAITPDTHTTHHYTPDKKLAKLAME